MSASEVISTLVTIGVQVKDTWTKSGKDWKTFLGSTDFAAIEATVEKLLGGIGPGELEASVVEIRKKEETLLNGRQIGDLTLDELAQFHALSDVEHQLVIKLLKTPRSDFLAVLVNDVLPVLVPIAKLVVQLLG
jgi:hypothetical protein